jgi:hypothetical protein
MLAMIDLATPAVITFLVAFAALALTGLVALVAGAAQLVSILRTERRMRLQRRQSVPAYYLGLARSH